MSVTRQIIMLFRMASFGSLPLLAACNTQAVVSDVVGDAGDGVNVPLDSDGDGFSDDVEINSTPGTDPLDATDNPMNVRDTDGDGCSDYDELNFVGFCDNNPSTPLRLACDVSYYNSDFGYGFDLPLLARLDRFDDEPFFAFNATWTLNHESAVISFVTRVADVEPPWSLEFVVESVNQKFKDVGAFFFVETPTVLADGSPAYLSGYHLDGVTVYTMDTAVGNQLYNVKTLVTTEDFTFSADSIMMEAVTSLCVD